METTIDNDGFLDQLIRESPPDENLACWIPLPLLARECPRLQQLTVRSCVHVVGCFCNAHLLRLVAGCTFIRVLKVELAPQSAMSIEEDRALPTSCLDDTALEALSTLTGLEELELCEAANFTNAGMQALERCPSLRSLSLGGLSARCWQYPAEQLPSDAPHRRYTEQCIGQVSDVGFAALSRSASLTSLTVHNSPLLTGTALHALAYCQGLTRLELSHCPNLVGIAPQRDAWPRLETLVSSYNGWDSLDGLASCLSLRHLSMDNGKIQDLAPLESCSKLRALKLFECGTRTPGWPYDHAAIPGLQRLEALLRRCNQLERIDFSHSAVPAAAMGMIAGCVALRVLILDHTRVADGTGYGRAMQDAELLPLAACRSLRFLSADLNSDRKGPSEEVRRHLIAALSRLQICPAPLRMSSDGRQQSARIPIYFEAGGHQFWNSPYQRGLDIFTGLKVYKSSNGGSGVMSWEDFFLMC